MDRPRVLERAHAIGAIDHGLPMARALEHMAARPPDAVVVALPLDAIVTLIPKLAELGAALEPARQPLVVDVGSVKGTVVAAAREAGCPRFVGGHPMAGLERGGIEHADAGLFEGASFALCPVSARKTDLDAARALVTRLGARPVVVDAARHDRAVAMTSHLPHLTAWALLDAARELDDRLAQRQLPWSLAGGSWRAATRVAASDPRLWEGILRHNREAVIESLDLLLARIHRVREVLEAGHDPLSEADHGLPGPKLARLARRRDKPRP